MIEQATYNCGGFNKATGIVSTISSLRLFPLPVGGSQNKIPNGGQFYRASIFVIVTAVTAADLLEFQITSIPSSFGAAFTFTDPSKVFDMPANAIGDIGCFEIIAPSQNLITNFNLTFVQGGGGNVTFDVYYKFDYID